MFTNAYEYKHASSLPLQLRKVAHSVLKRSVFISGDTFFQSCFLLYGRETPDKENKQ